MRKVSNPMTETIENTANLPYKNPELPTEERIADLLGRMTLEEKVGQMMQLDARSGDLDDLIVNKHVGSILHTSPSDLPKAVETVNTKTRLGIPLVIGDDCIHGYSFWPGATIFPEQLGMATTWDSEKVQAAGRATAEEVSTTGVHWTFSPHIRGGTVHLGRVFSGKGSAAVASHAAVRVHNNFAARQAGIPVGTAHDEFPGGVDEIFRPLIQKLRRKHIFNEFDAI